MKSAVVFTPIPIVAALLIPGCVSRSFSETKESTTATPLTKHERTIANEEQEIARSIRLAVAKIEKERTGNVTRRDAHPKHHGCLKGEFTVRNDVPEEAKHGIFATPATYKVWARVSNAGLVAGNRDDRIPDGRGVAIKLLNVPGRKVLLGAEDSRNADFLMVNVPFFIADDLKEYNDQLEDPTKALARIGELLRVVATGISDPLVHTYFSITPFALGDTAVKYKIASCEGQKPIVNFFPGPDYLRENLKKHLDPNTGTEGCFDFSVQFYRDDATTPVEKGTFVWQERTAPFIPIAQLRFKPQTFDFKERDTFCENVSFNPWRVPEGQQPLGNLNRGRREVYKAVAARRHADNNVKVPEPDGNEP